jgi:hypothetical protein
MIESHSKVEATFSKEFDFGLPEVPNTNRASLLALAHCTFTWHHASAWSCVAGSGPILDHPAKVA